CQNVGVTSPSPLERFQHKHRGSFTQVQSLAILVKGTARIWVQGLQRVEPTQGERTQCVTASRQHHWCRSIEKHVGREGDGHRARSARRRNRTARSAKS